MMKQGAVIGMDKAIVSNTSICEGCIMGKHTREPFRSHVEGRSVEVLQLVHTDVGESDVASWSGKKYYVTFIDDYSRCVWVYVIDKKSEVYDVFMKWKVLVENQTQHTIKAIRSDRGGEYINSRMREALDNSGIIHQTTMAESPQSNGVAERMNRTLWDQTRAMLYSASLQRQWWAQAILTAAYIHNRLVHSSTDGKTPMELWNGMKPDAAHMRVFGCIRYAHAPHSKRTKSGVQSIKCLFVGYSRDSKGYRVYDIERNKVIESRDVIFNENEMLELRVSPHITTSHVDVGMTRKVSVNMEAPSPDESSIPVPPVVPVNVQSVGVNGGGIGEIR